VTGRWPNTGVRHSQSRDYAGVEGQVCGSTAPFYCAA
jgi:hypothetical protein